MPDIYAYVAAWESGKRVKGKLPGGEIRITGMTAKEDRPIARIPFAPTSKDGEHVRWEDEIGGLAVHDGVAVVSMPKAGKFMRINVATGTVIDVVKLFQSPRGVAFEADGSLLFLSGSLIYR